MSTWDWVWLIVALSVLASAAGVGWLQVWRGRGEYRRLRASMTEQIDRGAALAKRIGLSTKLASDMEARAQMAEAKLESTERQVASLRGDVDAVCRQRDAAQVEEHEAREALRKVKRDRDSLEQQRDRLAGEINQARSDREAAIAMIARRDEALGEAAAEIMRCREQLAKALEYTDQWVARTDTLIGLVRGIRSGRPIGERRLGQIARALAAFDPEAEEAA